MLTVMWMTILLDQRWHEASHAFGVPMKIPCLPLQGSSTCMSVCSCFQILAQLFQGQFRIAYAWPTLASKDVAPARHCTCIRTCPVKMLGTYMPHPRHITGRKMRQNLDLGSLAMIATQLLPGPDVNWSGAMPHNLLGGFLSPTNARQPPASLHELN